jgi:hypothetical protein
MNDIVLTSLTRSELKEIIKNSILELGLVTAQNAANEEPTENEQPMNLTEAAAWLGITPSTMVSYKKKGLVPYYQLPNSSKVRFYKSELRKVFQQNSKVLKD